MDGREMIIPTSSNHKKWLNMFDGNVAPVTLDAAEAYKLGLDDISSKTLQNLGKKWLGFKFLLYH